jgi:hypothetical protein
MRFLFFVPLGTKRNLNATSGVAMALRRLGHDVHAFTREVTRVHLDGSFVLSRNELLVQGLQAELGRGSVSCLHSNLSTRELPAESPLVVADRAIMQAFAQTYRPDAVVTCDDALMALDPMILAADAVAGGGARRLSIHLQADSQQWFLRNGENAMKLPRSNTPQMVDLLRDHVLKGMDTQRSLAGLRETLKLGAGRLAKFERLEPVAVHTVPQLVQNTIANGSSFSQVVPGELESVKNTDVIFGGTLWLKGWVDFRDSGLKNIRIRVNDSVHECVPNNVRGELAERFKNPDILGFEAHIPLEGEGAQLHVRLSLCYKDGREHDWKNLFLWADDSVPRRYKSPSFTGEANLSQEADQQKIGGCLNAEGYQVHGIRAVQCGAELGAWTSPAGQALTRVEFHIDLAPSTDLRRPVHLWVNLDGEGWIHWLRCLPKTVLSTSTSLQMTGISEGQVVRGMDISIGVRVPTPGQRILIYINGVEAVQSHGGGAHRELTLPLGKVGNDVLVEVTSDGGDYAAYQLWRHLDEPLARAYRSSVTVPNKSVGTIAPSVTVAGKRKLLLIRKAPAPTDELYVLAPLQPLVEQGRIEVATVDLDTTKFTQQLVDGLLKPGTVVVVSRYISDEWIQALTARKHLLGPIFYLMDDDVLAAEDTRWLPADYRARMAKVGHGEFQTMVNLCDRFIVTSEFLAHRFRSQKTKLLEPPYLQAPRDMRHFDKGPFVVAYHGTLAHRDDVAMIAPALRHIHDRYTDVRVQIVMGNHVPDYLKGLSRVEIVRAMPWDKYKEYSEKVRAHIAVAPVLRTPYNLGKSIIKIHDIASLGAAGLYTRSDPYTKYITDGHDGVLLESDPLMWQKALMLLIEQPEKAKSIAVAGQALAQRIGPLNKLTEYWAAEIDAISESQVRPERSKERECKQHG